MISTLLGLILGLASAADDARKGLEPFQGSWVLIAYTVDGKPASAEEMKAIALRVQGRESTFTKGEVVRHGIYKLDLSQDPKALDIELTDGPEKGRNYRSIYEFTAAGHLRICHALPGKERPKTFASQVGTGNVLEVWRKK